jgi:hypothetical protein
MRSLRVTFLLLATLGAGCQKLDPEGGDAATLGDLGRVDFKYRRSCFFGCPLAQPLLSGTRESIELSGPGNDPDVRVRSSDRDVLVVAVERACHCVREDSTNRLDIALNAECADPWTKACENRVLVEAVAPGEAMLELLDEDGMLVDRAEVLVREAASAEVFATLPDALGEQAGHSFAFGLGEQLALRVELYDEAGLSLLAPEGVTWRSADPQIATLTAFLLGSGEEIEVGRDVSVEAHAAGTTQIAIEVPGLTYEVDVEIEE